MNMSMMMASNSNSITVGIGSLTTFPVNRTRTHCNHIHFLAIPRGSFSFTLSLRRSRRRSLNILSIISALDSGLEASIADAGENSAALKDAKIVLESGDENKIQLRVDLTGDQTQRVFDKTLISLGRSAPPVPGFRMAKGGKSSKIPTDFLVQMLGEDRVTKFVIQEILNTTMADYAEKENLDVKDRKISTTQTAEELKRSFRPGKEFGFNVIIEPENSQDSS